MDKLIWDSDQSDISNREKDMLITLFIHDWKYQLHYQHQNFAERQHYTAKRQTTTLIDTTGAPARKWFLFITYEFCVKPCLQFNY